MISNARKTARLIAPKVFFAVSLLLWSFSAFSQNRASPSSGCGTLYSTGQYGPYDYRTDRDKLPIVEGAHFTAAVEALIRGTTSARPGGDIDYTLRAIPNNHRALMAMVRLGEREKTTQPSGSRYSIDCWFERATLFRPDDAIVRMIYSSYLNTKNRIPEASQQLEMATTYAKDSGFTHYNIGLHHFDLKNYDKALAHAHAAMALSFAQTALRDQLLSVGKWVEPTKAPAPKAADSPPDSAPITQPK